MERKSSPVSPATSRNPSPVKSPRREACTELPTLDNASSPLPQRIARRSGQFFKRLTLPLFQDSPPQDGAPAVLVREHQATEKPAAPEEVNTPRTERRRLAGLGRTKTANVQNPKRLNKSLRSFVLDQHTERALKLSQHRLPSVAELQAQIGEEIERLQHKIDQLKAIQAEYEEPTPLRRDGPLTEAIELMLQPVVERQVLEQCVQAIHCSAQSWPTQAGGRKLDLAQLSPEQVSTLCATIASQTIVAQRLLHNLPEGFADMGAALLKRMNQAFPDLVEANFRVIAGGLVLRSLMGPFHSLAAATLGVPKKGGEKGSEKAAEKQGKGKAVDLSGLSPYINFCNDVMVSFVNGSAVHGLEAMPAELQNAIAAAGAAIRADMQRVVTATGL